MYSEWQAFLEQERQRELIQTIIMWSVILLLGIAIITLIGVLYKASRPIPEPEPLLVDGYIDYIADDEYEEEEEALPSLEDVELQKKSTGLEQIEKFIDRDASAVAQLLRNWLIEE
jgi:flagellar biosynthesis/type III secretory pathway M-ring protein FliF/YscJ